MTNEAREQANTTKRKVCLQLQHIKKDYYVDKKPFTAIHDLSVNFPDTGFVAILGHSGSGKTTLLNIIGGLDHYTEGDMLIDGKSTKDYGDRDWDNYRNKRIGFVFQSYKLIPHLNVLQNVVISLQLGGLKKKEREAKAAAVLEAVGLGDYLRKRPNQLSGGQMQRVAIARALVNDPDIILADEPTGALDSATSVQVMDLIREVGKDRCVIMVTHNRELADQYADRIIEMKDGYIVNDTNPLEIEEEQADLKPKGKRSAMSFWTALGSSWRNIRTKKGRTALTAIACSIGIIGVALVLATSNGFSQYVGEVEVGIASSVPISITPVGYRIKIPNASELPPEFPSEKVVKVYDSSTTLSTPVYNDLSQEYFNYLDAMMTDRKCSAYGAAMSIMYNRKNLDYHFIVNDVNGDIRSVDQYSSAGTLGSAISSVTSLPATILHELYGDEKSMSSMYETIEGRYPTEVDEMALILDRYNRIDFSTMKKLGFFASNTIFDASNPNHTQIDFSKILYQNEQNPGMVQFKCYTNANYYKLPAKAEDLPSVLKTANVNSHNQIHLEATGTPGEDFALTVTSGEEGTTPINYVPSPGGIETVYADDATFKPVKLKIVGILRPTAGSYIQLMPTSLAYTPKLSKLMADAIAPGTTAYALGEMQKHNWVIPRSANEKSDGLVALNTVAKAIAEVINNEKSFASESAMVKILTQLSNGLPNAMVGYNALGGGATGSNSTFLRWCLNLGVEFAKIDDLENYLVNAMLDGPEKYFSSASAENIMDLLAYQNSYSLITSVLIFPSSLTTKEAIHKYLDSWNDTHPDNEVAYSDIMDDLTSGLSTMISVISAVLIVFASISLVVSSVMTAIITYVSVIERTKEIGVLRACGGRKRDVSRLFEAECVIIGLFAGGIGILFTILACIPINLILDSLFPGNNLSTVAQLNPLHAVLLLALSVGLAFASGFIPARIAAKKDPVICLRSE